MQRRVGRLGRSALALKEVDELVLSLGCQMHLVNLGWRLIWVVHHGLVEWQAVFICLFHSPPSLSLEH